MGNSIKFGTDGWRSVIADDFTFENISLVTKAIGMYLKEIGAKRGVFIGYDNRFLSEEFALCSANVLKKEGINVFLSSESIPTPTVAFMVREMGLNGALMFTASHNPPKYNGIKFIPHYGGPAGQEITKKIEENIADISSGHNHSRGINKKSAINYVSDFSSYVQKLVTIVNRNLIKRAHPLVCLDTMHGSGSRLLPMILNEELGLDAMIMHNWRDPLFGGKLPDPSENNLNNLIKEIREKKLDMGLALDGDADRFGVIDRKGVFISPNNVIALILYYFTETGRKCSEDRAVRTIATTHLIDDICKDNNIGIEETPVGFKHIGKAMLKGDVLIGGEESGGLSIKEHIPEKDGLLANLLLLEIQSYLKENDKGPYLSDYLQEIYDHYGTFYNTRLDMKVSMDKKDKIIDYFAQLKGTSIEGNEVIDVNSVDGIKLLLNNHKAWLLIRASGTEPLIRCYIETTDKNFFVLLKTLVENKFKILAK